MEGYTRLDDSHIPKEQDGLGAYQYGDRVRKILHMLEIEGVLCALVEWRKREDGFQPKVSFVLVEKELRVQDPLLLFDYLLSLEWEIEENDGGSRYSTEEQRSVASSRHKRSAKMPVIHQVVEQQEMSVIRAKKASSRHTTKNKDSRQSQNLQESYVEQEQNDRKEGIPINRIRVLKYNIYTTQRQNSKDFSLYKVTENFIRNCQI